MEEKLDYKDLYFGVTVPTWDGELKTYNIFDCIRVIRSIYAYKKYEKVHPDMIKNNPLYYCFGELGGRVEWEMMVEGMSNDSKSNKTDVYNMYIVPNKDLLLKWVDQVTLSSIRKVVKELGYKV